MCNLEPWGPLDKNIKAGGHIVAEIHGRDKGYVFNVPERERETERQRERQIDRETCLV